MTKRSTPPTEAEVTFSGAIGHAAVMMIKDEPLEAALATEESGEALTRVGFEDALDKVSRDEADVADARAALEETGEIAWEEVKRKHEL